MTSTDASGNSFIDDDHIGLLDHMQAICASLEDGWNPITFKANIGHFIDNLESHFSHEEREEGMIHICCDEGHMMPYKQRVSRKTSH